MNRSILDYLEESEERYPKKIAFADVNTSCTYQELGQRARKIATALSRRVKPGQPVPVFMDKSVDTICLFMGVVYAGCFYVLLDTKQPKARIQQILETLRAEVLITTKDYDKDREGLISCSLCMSFRNLRRKKLTKTG